MPCKSKKKLGKQFSPQDFQRWLMVEQDYRDMQSTAQCLKTLVKVGLYLGSTTYELYDLGHVV